MRRTQVLHHLDAADRARPALSRRHELRRDYRSDASPGTRLESCLSITGGNTTIPPESLQDALRPVSIAEGKAQTDRCDQVWHASERLHTDVSLMDKESSGLDRVLLSLLRERLL